MILDSGSEEIRLGEIGRRLGNIFSDFDVRNYHYSKLSEFVSEFESLSLKKINNAYWVSLQKSPIKEIEKMILFIFNSSQAKELNIGELKQRLTEQMPDIDDANRRSDGPMIRRISILPVSLLAITWAGAALAQSVEPPPLPAPSPSPPLPRFVRPKVGATPSLSPFSE